MDGKVLLDSCEICCRCNAFIERNSERVWLVGTTATTLDCVHVCCV